MTEKLSVSAIKNGTVIDHITSGQAFAIMQLLKLNKSAEKITIGLNLTSNRLGRKDIIKIENKILTDTNANEIVVFAPLATINIIEQYKVAKKFTTHLPNLMHGVFKCPNTLCITHCEKTDNLFLINEQAKQVLLTCFYCDKTFNRNQVSLF